jgi:hypothetical protein
VHLDVRGNTLFRNKIRFVCMKLGCGVPQEGIEPSTYRCFEEDLSDVQSGCSTTELRRHGGLECASTRDRTEVPGFKARCPDHWTIEADTSGGIRTHEV